MQKNKGAEERRRSMKQGKRLTRRQKIFLSAKNLNIENWLCERETAEYIRLIHKHTGTVRVICKEK